MSKGGYDGENQGRWHAWSQGGNMVWGGGLMNMRMGMGMHAYGWV